MCDGRYKGKQYFDCPPKGGLFVKLSVCRPDDSVSGANKNTSNGYSGKTCFSGKYSPMEAVCQLLSTRT